MERLYVNSLIASVESFEKKAIKSVSYIIQAASSEQQAQHGPHLCVPARVYVLCRTNVVVRSIYCISEHSVSFHRMGWIKRLQYIETRT